MPPPNLHRHWHAPSLPSRARPIDEDGAPPGKTTVDNDHHRSDYVVDVSHSRGDDDLDDIDDGGGSDGSSEGSTCRARPAYPHGLHRHWHASSNISGHDGGDHHRSDYVVDLLEKIDEGSGSVGSSEAISQPSKEEKEPLKQFYYYRHRFYNEQYHHLDDSQFASGRHGLDNVDDSIGIESVCSFVTLSEAFDRSSQEGDAFSTASSITEQNSQYYPSRERSRSVDSFYSQHASYSHSPSNSSSYISTVSSVTLSRALDDDLEWRERHDRDTTGEGNITSSLCRPTRGFCVDTRLGDFVEDVPSPQSVSDILAPDVIEDYLTDEEKYSLVDKGVAGSNSTAIRTTKTAIDNSQDLVDFGRISTATTKQFSTMEASTMEADVATATEALTLAEKEGRR
jgi:hypothetical protein